MTNHLVHSPFKASINRLLVFAFPPFLTVALFFVFFHAQTNHPAANHGNYELHQALTLPSLLLTRDDYTCDLGKPCSNGACCGESGFCGYGPTYCGDGCTSNCNATAECGQFATTPNATCPLNVCCSQHGFCGTTADFCGEGCQSNCGTPSVPAGGNSQNVTSKVIAYYESWSDRRSCHDFPPTAIPYDALTHVNFAFAYIDPETYTITTMDSQTPAKLFQEVADIKTKALSDLEVFIAIGGWTFSDNDTVTQPLLGEIAASEENRQKFADNLVRFLATYGFDGVDIDWEYPGAPDRGGKEEDTENFVKLFKTLRETFNKSLRGSYGLTFTIPSSYWYLQWFDLPGLLEYADWVNLMSYDLHGTWDSTNPIGSIIQGHTNLTEIKQAADLLWRNNVPPRKVMLGTGFYGRSFELEDAACTKPGCHFSGAAKKGKCTNSAGTLAYFEIQDILKEDSSIDVIYDKKAAVNYFSFGKNQWVSFDDRTSFQAKVDWANEVGLGGLMIWAIDMDDDDFTALSGLLDQEVGSRLELTGRGTVKEEEEAASWTSMDGSKCEMMGCGEACPAGKSTTVGYANSDCKNSKQKKVCCPPSSAPSSCTWRGGEKGGAGRACHGQCHTGELTLFFMKNGNRNCATGNQVFCCTADAYADLIDDCYYSECGDVCKTGEVNVAEKYDPNKCSDSDPFTVGSPKYRQLCCPSGTAMDDCHWVGKGYCDQNNCDENDVQLDTDAYGDSKSRCGHRSRRKSLCCNAPKGENPFLPVSLDDIFPEVPPSADIAKFDLQLLGAHTGYTDLNQVPNEEAFGFILIDGPSSVVSNLDKRDGSHIEFLDCDSITDSKEKQVTRIVCTNDGPSSNCDDMLEDGLPGTVIKLPQSCKIASWAVARSLAISSNQTLPHRLQERMAASRYVMDLTFDFNFGLVKRADSDIYLRVDYSNLRGYWNLAVDSDGDKKRRDLKTYNKRFFSDSEASWLSVFNSVRDYDDDDYTEFDTLLDATLIANTIDCDDGEEFTTITTTGSVSAHAKWGLSLVGTLSPFNLEEAYGFFDVDFDMYATVGIKANGGLDINRSKNLLSSAIAKKAFKHPGLVSMVPSLQIATGVVTTEEFSMNGTAQISYRVSSDGYIRSTYPRKLEKPSGSLNLYEYGPGFVGLGVASGNNLRVRVNPMWTMSLTIDPYSDSSTSLVESEFTSGFVSYAQLQASDEGEQCALAYAAAEAAQVELFQEEGKAISNWDADDDQTVIVGERPGSREFGKTCTAPNSAPFSPSDSEMAEALYDASNYLICAADTESSVNTTHKCFIDISVLDSDLDLDPDSGDPYESAASPPYENARRMSKRKLVSFDSSIDWGWTEEEEEEMTLDKRGNPRKFKGGNDKITWTSQKYDSINELDDDDVLDAWLGLADDEDCSKMSISTEGDANQKYVTEHILELQTVRMCMDVMMYGKLEGERILGSDVLLVPEQYFGDNGGVFHEDFGDWAENGLTGTPEDRIGVVMGSETDPSRLVRAEKNLNGMKARLWKAVQGISDKKWNRAGLDNPSNINVAVSVLRSIGSVFSYLTEDEVQTRMAQTHNLVREEWRNFQDAVNVLRALNEEAPLDIVAMWDKCLAAILKRMVDKALAWWYERWQTLYDYWRARLDSLQSQPETADETEVEDAEFWVNTLVSLRRDVELETQMGLLTDGMEGIDLNG